MERERGVGEYTQKLRVYSSAFPGKVLGCNAQFCTVHLQVVGLCNARRGLLLKLGILLANLHCALDNGG